MKDNRPDKKTMKGYYKAADEVHKHDKGYNKIGNIQYVISLALVIIIAMSLRLFVTEPTRVSGDSMYPTLLNGERMFVDKTSYLFNEPKRGDIIICYYPNHTASCVKRVIALPGETVCVMDGVVYVNDEPLDESEYWNDYVFYNTWPVIVPEKCVFVMGDNRNESLDSRSAEVGPIPYNRIVGRARSVIWPLSSFRSLALKNEI